jgi:hypothetical protein
MEKIINVVGEPKIKTDAKNREFLSVPHTNPEKPYHQAIYAEKEKWELIQSGAIVKLEGTQRGQFFNVESFTLELPEDRPKGEAPDMVQAAKTMGAKLIGSTDDTRLRSMAIAYAKDVFIAGKCEQKEIPKWADSFLKYILDIK